jgi:hypothetical protein
VGCEARKIPAEGEVFFLDFYLYRTNQDLAGYRYLALKESGYRTALLDIFRRKHSAVDNDSLNEAGKQ